MWTYSQSRGVISHDGKLLGTGYSGHERGLDNGTLESIPDVGPIPRGKWKIVRWDDVHGDKGPVVAVLEPVGHDAHGRSCFLIHGDNSKGDHSASHGCIIAGKYIRESMRRSGDTDLEVVA